MSEPKHILLHPDTAADIASDEYPRHPEDLRYTLTSGPEFEALMERARDALIEGYASVQNEALQDLLAYFEEQP